MVKFAIVGIIALMQASVHATLIKLGETDEQKKKKCQVFVKDDCLKSMGMVGVRDACYDTDSGRYGKGKYYLQKDDDGKFLETFISDEDRRKWSACPVEPEDAPSCTKSWGVDDKCAWRYLCDHEIPEGSDLEYMILNPDDWKEMKVTDEQWDAICDT